MNPAFEKHLESNQFIARWEKAETVGEKCAVCEEFLKKKGKWPTAVESKTSNTVLTNVGTSLPPLPPPPKGPCNYCGNLGIIHDSNGPRPCPRCSLPQRASAPCKYCGGAGVIYDHGGNTPRPCSNCITFPATGTYTATSAYTTQNKIQYLNVMTEIPEPPIVGNIMPALEIATRDLVNNLAMEIMKRGYVQITQEQNHMAQTRRIKATVGVLKP
jgi:hypothetical protein